MPFLWSFNASIRNHGQHHHANLVVSNISSTNSVDWLLDIGVNRHLTLDLANLTGSKPYLSNLIICMLVMIRAFPYLILDILRYIHQNTLLPYLMFFMYLILPSHCFMFKNFIMIIMSILNFTSLYFIVRISTPRQCFFLVRATMISMFCPSFLPHQFLKLTCLLAYLFLLISDIVD
jgi:hypothetical protein